MISHACGSCGKMLDSASRSHSNDLHMWIARCGRCGLAVRWSPRAAREPARTWARLRTLNLRLGVALTLAQAAGVVLVAMAALLAERVILPYGEGLLDALASPLTMLVIVVAALSGVSGAVMAPHKRPLPRAAAAWLIGVAPVVLTIGGLFAPWMTYMLANNLDPLGARGTFEPGGPFATAVLATLVSFALSIPLGALGATLISPIVATALRRRAREIRATAPGKSVRGRHDQR
jgi:hypothetical protein